MEDPMWMMLLCLPRNHKNNSRPKKADVVLVDLTRAYDTAWHRCLTCKSIAIDLGQLHNTSFHEALLSLMTLAPKEG